MEAIGRRENPRLWSFSRFQRQSEATPPSHDVKMRFSRAAPVAARWSNRWALDLYQGPPQRALHCALAVPASACSSQLGSTGPKAPARVSTERYLGPSGVAPTAREPCSAPPDNRQSTATPLPTLEVLHCWYLPTYPYLIPYPH